ncbi:MAG: hypothetical protein EOS82_03280 [Mesorhizobium sp.]|uniref:hypothetical protein n=1 Tax=Mesorhizobium sp. TaxID=1871066 RepID=UPI000FE826A5|nr:hypothetical protein [Mesorhizobium sp.]RWQ56532.1 MAG: hypothetical protein EOS82_03280 [Mesorhizobium sp.]
MKSRLSNPVLANRGCKLAGIGFTERLVPRRANFSNVQRSSIDEPSLEAGPQAEASLAGIGSRTFADREGRLEGEVASADLPAISSPSQENAAAAGAPDLPAPAAFSHYTESCPDAFHGQASAAPDVPTPASGAVHRTSHAIHLPEHVMVLVRAIAAYERCSNERAAVLALAEYAQMIGAGPLARAVLDLSDDLADVPDFPRRAYNRFRGGP